MGMIVRASTLKELISNGKDNQVVSQINMKLLVLLTARLPVQLLHEKKNYNGHIQ